MATSSSSSSSHSKSSQSQSQSTSGSGCSFSTQDVVDGDFDDIEEEEHLPKPWGRLLPVNARFFKTVDLVNAQYTFGRDEHSDYIFKQSDLKHCPQFTALSKNHFRIYREQQGSDPNNFTVFIEDLSSNGTFIRDEKIGKNNQTVLNHNDEVALATKKNKAFVFFDLNSANKELEKYPEELKQKYALSRVLGTGACGEVRLAFENSTNRRFAIKIISKKRFSVGPQLQRSMMEEVRILRQLQHPNIIRIEDVFDSNDALYIVLEVVDGGELFDRVVKVKRFEEPTAKLLFYQMLLAVKLITGENNNSLATSKFSKVLCYLHNNDITHRDLKPENVLLSTEDNETLVKITDFGLSRFVGQDSLMKTLCGTPNYLAPEVLKSAGMGGYKKVVDCWSLGCILYICLGGYPPFSDEIKEFTLYQQITDGRYSFPEKYWNHVSKDGIDLIRKLLCVDPDQRISVTEALEHPWINDENMKEKARRLMTDDSSSMPPPAAPGSSLVFTTLPYHRLVYASILHHQKRMSDTVREEQVAKKAKTAEVHEN